MPMKSRKNLFKSAVICWVLALLFGGCGAYCGVRDPFFTSEGIGSGISALAAWAGLGIGFCLVVAGLLFIRQIALSLALVNLAVFIIAAMFLVRDSYTVVGNTVPDFISSRRWEMVFAILAVSLLMCMPIYLLFSKWRSNGVSRGRGCM
jgi:hypothetical protein